MVDGPLRSWRCCRQLHTKVATLIRGEFRHVADFLGRWKLYVQGTPHTSYGATTSQLIMVQLQFRPLGRPPNTSLSQEQSSSPTHL